MYSAMLEFVAKYIHREQPEDAFYVLDIEDLLRKHINWMQKMPAVKPYYAVKCNPHPVLLEIFGALGINFDCASQGEIEAVLRKGISADRIIFANPCKIRSHLEYAKRYNVSLMTFDSESELKKIAEVYPEARLVLRIQVDDRNSRYHLNDKFGAPQSDVGDLLKTAALLKLNIVGISFHVGSECTDPSIYEDAIKRSREAFDIGNDLGFNMKYIDIGGGFPGNSIDNDHNVLDAFAGPINAALERHRFRSESVKVLAEPGRYFVASAFTLLTKIIGKKKNINIINGNSNGARDTTNQVGINYYLNDGRHGSFSVTSFGEEDISPIPFLNNEQLERRQATLSAIWGPTCDSLDVIRERIVMPEMLEDEWLYFEMMGAYTMSIATKFNGFNATAVKIFLSSTAAKYFRKRNLDTCNKLLSSVVPKHIHDVPQICSA